MLHHDGDDPAAAQQTVREVGDTKQLDDAFDDAFQDSRQIIKSPGSGQLSDLMLNDPETSLQPDWMAALARLIVVGGGRSRASVVSPAGAL